MDINAFIANMMQDRGRWQKLINSPLSYRVVGEALKLARKNFTCEAVYRESQFALRYTGQAYAHKSPVVWSSFYFPDELTWSLGLTPFSPEAAAAFATSLGFGAELLSEGEEAGYSRDICSFHRCIAGAAYGGYYPRPDALLASTVLCDGIPLLFTNMAAHYGSPLFLLDLPYGCGPEAERQVAVQLERIWRELAEAVGRKPDLERLRQAIVYSNSFRANMEETNRLRCQVPAPINGEEIMSLLYLFLMGQGSREAAEITARLLADVSQRAAAKQQAMEPERYRLLWLQLRPYYKNEMDQFIRQQGAVLACEEMDHIYWPPLDPEQPFASLARKVLANYDYKPVEERIRVVRELGRRYRVDGIVHFSQHGCRQATGGSLLLKEALQDEFPVLLLEGDYLDAASEAAGSMLTRLQAFFEIMDSRKTRCCR
jgi:benzoyl-CoA reductase/2-hydroxyglutaryl-CoA dehydratase subunit BcrC/BadD/HgdB